MLTQFKTFAKFTRNKRCTFFFVALLSLSTRHAPAVTIAILDSGANPELVQAQLRLQPGFDYVNDDDTPDDASVDLHGTAIANIILGQTGNSQVLPLKVTEPGAGFTVERGGAAMTRIISSSDVKVIDHNGLQPTPIDLLRQAVSAGKIIVIQAGDNGLSNPANLARSVPLMAGGAMIVGGIDSNRQLSPSSNAAGDLQDFYLVAPASSNHAILNGTDVAKSNTAAAAAILIEAAPNLSAQEVVQILLTTATDLGALGVDTIFGHGALNLEEALKPQGVTNVGGNNSGGSGAGALVALGVAGAVGYALLNRPEKLQKTLIMDQFDRPYTINLIGRAPILGQQSAASMLGFNRLDQYSVTQNQVSIFGKGFTSLTVTDQAKTTSLSDQNKPPNQLISLRQQVNTGNKTLLSLLNQPIKQSFGLVSNAPNTPTDLVKLNSSYLDLSKRGFGLVISSSNPADALSSNNHKFGLAFGDPQIKHSAPTKSVIYQGNMNKKWGEIGLQLAYTHENGSLLGGASNGVFSVKAADTLSSMVGGMLNLGSKWSIGGSYAIGRTQVKPENGSLLTQFSTLNSSAAELKVLGKSIFRPHDSILVNISQPISFTKGLIGLSIPTRVDTNNQPLFSHQTIQLDGLGSVQTRYEIRYHRPLSRSSSLTAKLLRRDSKIEQQSLNGFSLAYSHQL